MNILFFLKPKSEVAFIYDYSTLRQVLETMEFHKYASIPVSYTHLFVWTICMGSKYSTDHCPDFHTDISW